MGGIVLGDVYSKNVSTVWVFMDNLVRFVGESICVREWIDLRVWVWVFVHNIIGR